MADPVHEYDRLQTALDLVAEAYDVLNARESTVDIRDWTKSAEKLLEDFGRLPIVAAVVPPWPWDVPDPRD